MSTSGAGGNLPYPLRQAADPDEFAYEANRRRLRQQTPP
jgi:hypothetical protein